MEIAYGFRGYPVGTTRIFDVIIRNFRPIYEVSVMSQIRRNLFVIFDQSATLLVKIYSSFSTNQRRRSDVTDTSKFARHFRPICEVADTSQIRRNSFVIFDQSATSQVYRNLFVSYKYSKTL